MLPISAADIIDFQPGRERVDRAESALAKLKSTKKPDKEILSAAEKAVADAQAALLADPPPPSYRLRVPTERSRAALNRDLSAEGVVLRSNEELIDVLLSAPDEISPEDADAVRVIKDSIKPNVALGEEDWRKLHAIARSVPASAEIIADRVFYATMYRIHAIRHHLILDGVRTPLPERAFDDFARTNPSDAMLIGDKIESLMTVGAPIAKN
jgi:hypothetical protein